MIRIILWIEAGNLLRLFKQTRKTTMLRYLPTKWGSTDAFGTLFWGRIMARLLEKNAQGDLCNKCGCSGNKY